MALLEQMNNSWRPLIVAAIGLLAAAIGWAVVQIQSLSSDVAAVVAGIEADRRNVNLSQMATDVAVTKVSLENVRIQINDLADKVDELNDRLKRQESAENENGR